MLPMLVYGLVSILWNVASGDWRWQNRQESSLMFYMAVDFVFIVLITSNPPTHSRPHAHSLIMYRITVIPGEWTQRWPPVRCSSTSTPTRWTKSSEPSSLTR
mmetsp:Transcript_19377/g.26634  ORF Transcript_19377/g.26634 Transcript_19377/m.26634 type:complete len:102 (+) Transcript_19377:384-689(+)